MINKAKDNPFEYLGFSFDGKKSLIKSQTLGRYYKKLIYAIEAGVNKAAKKAKKNHSSDIKKYLDISTIYNKYSNSGRNWCDKRKSENKQSENFMSYIKRSHKIMIDTNSLKQVKSHKRFIKKAIDRKIANLGCSETADRVS